MTTDTHKTDPTAIPPLSLDRDVEKSPITPPSGAHPDQISHTEPGRNLIPGHHVSSQLDKLKLYQELVGISSSNDIDNGTGTSLLRPVHRIWWYARTTKNTGYYNRICDEEFRTTIYYAAVACVYNTSLMLQVLVAATITALAAFSERRVTITVLGGINTAIAGLIAYLKGQGLPHRLFQYRNQMRRVREYAEYMERKFEMDVETDLDSVAAADAVKKMYDAARKDQEDNIPDNYVNAAEKIQMANLNLGPAKTGTGAATGVTAVGSATK